MLEFKYQRNVLVRVHATCKKHPTYSPARGLEGPIKGNCPGCLELLAVWKAKLEADAAIQRLIEVAEPFHPNRNRKTQGTQ